MSKVPSKVKRGIFVLDHHGLGNVVLSLPLLQSISQWASSKCDVKVLFRSPEHFQVIQNDISGIEPVYLQNRYEGLKGLCRLRMDFGGTVDMLVAVPGVPASTAVAVKMALGAEFMVGEAWLSRRWLFSVSAKKGWGKSILKSQQELAQSLGLKMDVPHPVLRLTEEEEAWGDQIVWKAFKGLSNPIVGVQCGTKEIAKQWPAHSFGQTLALLKSRFPDLCVISFGSKGEQEKTVAARAEAGSIPWLDGVGQWTIRESLAILKRCALVFSGDTGIMHMAASLGVATVSVFGPTSPERLAPLYAGGVCAKPMASCHPCFRDKWTACRCIELIQPEEMVSLMAQCLERPKLPQAHFSTCDGGFERGRCVDSVVDASCKK